MGQRKIKGSSELLSDFWWLPENVTFDDLAVGVGHHKEIADNENVPPLESWYRSLTPKGDLSNEVNYYSINSLNEWRNACNNTNVYRTLKVFERSRENVTYLGPFLIDIDNSQLSDGYVHDLNDAQAVAKQVVTYLIEQHELSSDDLRIFFSGCKGFNIEIRPEALGIEGPTSDQIRLSSINLGAIIANVRNNNNIQDSSTNIVSACGTVIDTIYGDRFRYYLKHPYIRLHNSINKWINGGDKAIARRKMGITYAELLNKSAEEISTESERQGNPS